MDGSDVFVLHWNEFGLLAEFHPDRSADCKSKYRTVLGSDWHGCTR
jgi:hypothetical protein